MKYFNKSKLNMKSKKALWKQAEKVKEIIDMKEVVDNIKAFFVNSYAELMTYYGERFYKE